MSNCSAFDNHQIDSDEKWTSLFSNWEYDVFDCSIDEIADAKEIWQKIANFMRREQHIEVLKKTISKSNKMFEEMTLNANKVNHHHQRQHSDLHLSALRSYKEYGNQIVAKSMSLSRITGRNYKRNLVALDRTKSISNEFLNGTANFVADTISLIECNNNADNGFGDERQSSSSFNQLDMPCFGMTKLDTNDLRLIRDYLTKAFKSQYHPLGILNTRISNCFYTSYGCWKVKPIAIVAAHAMQDWDSLSRRIYEFTRKMFPTLPQHYSHMDEYV